MTSIGARQQVVVGLQHFLQRAFASRYFMYALLVHLAVLACLGTRIVYKAILPSIPPGPVDKRFLDDWRPPPPPPKSAQQTEVKPDGAKGGEVAKDYVNASTASRLPTVVSVRRQTPNPFPDLLGSFVLPSFTSGPSSFGNGDQRPPTFDRDHYERVLEFQGGWIDRRRWNGTSIPPSTFTCYLAKYADGDWNCNPTALDNMLTQVHRWSKGRINAAVQPKPLDLASGEIFQIKPPFIFFTGHKDFHLTEDEVNNLREYLLSGGTVWADNSLPGRHSRFDEAFRREMKRVLPDREFEAVPKDHPIFRAHFRLREAPGGMNYYAEPVEQITFRGETVVMYTLNAYSDLWETALNEQDKIDTDTYIDEDRGTLYTKWGPHWGSYLTGFLYRHVSETSIVEANQLGLNVIVHLLTQYEDKFRMLGKL